MFAPFFCGRNATVWTARGQVPGRALRYVFLTTFAIVSVIFPATFIYFYAFFLTTFSIPLFFYPNHAPAARLSVVIKSSFLAHEKLLFDE